MAANSSSKITNLNSVVLTITSRQKTSMQPMLDENGQPVLDAEGNPREELQVVRNEQGEIQYENHLQAKAVIEEWDGDDKVDEYLEESDVVPVTFFSDAGTLTGQEVGMGAALVDKLRSSFQVTWPRKLPNGSRKTINLT